MGQNEAAQFQRKFSDDFRALVDKALADGLQAGLPLAVLIGFVAAELIGAAALNHHAFWDVSPMPKELDEDAFIHIARLGWQSVQVKGNPHLAMETGHA